jgi:hypothetical protein
LGSVRRGKPPLLAALAGYRKFALDARLEGTDLNLSA